MADPIQTETPRLKALRSLAANLPVANQRVAQGQKAAQDLQLQQAVKAAPTSTPVAATAQATGASMAQTAGEQQAKSAEQSAQTGQQIGQVGLAEQGRAGQEKVASLQAGQKQQEMDSLSRLAGISEQAKQELYDQQMQFKKDEAGRTLFNTRQLADYAVTSAKNDEELKNYQQNMELASKRKAELMDAAYNKLKEELTSKYELAKAKGDYEGQRQIKEFQNDIEERKAKENAELEKNLAIMKAMFSVAGAAGKAAGS